MRVGNSVLNNGIHYHPDGRWFQRSGGDFSRKCDNARSRGHLRYDWGKESAQNQPRQAGRVERTGGILSTHTGRRRAPRGAHDRDDVRAVRRRRHRRFQRRVVVPVPGRGRCPPRPLCRSGVGHDRYHTRRYGAAGSHRSHALLSVHAHGAGVAAGGRAPARRGQCRRHLPGAVGDRISVRHIHATNALGHSRDLF